MTVRAILPTRPVSDTGGVPVSPSRRLAVARPVAPSTGRSVSWGLALLDQRGPILWWGGAAISGAALLHAQSIGSRWIWLTVVTAAAGLVWFVVRREPKPDAPFAGRVGWRDARASMGSLPTSVLAPTVVAGVGTVANTLLGFRIGHGWVAVSVAVVLGAAAVGASLAPDRMRIGPVTPAFLFVLAHTFVVLLWLRATLSVNDVELVLREGSRELLAGHNPYAMTFPNVYSAEFAEQLYGPGFLVDNRIPYGFPYPPVLLLAAVPGYLLGDVRYGPLAALLAVALIAHGVGRRRTGRAAAVALTTAPGAVNILYAGWTEPFVVLLVAVVGLALFSRRWMTAAVAIGVLLVSKQYFVVTVPCLWLLRAHATPRRVAALVGTAAVLTMPWLLADPGAFLRSLVGYQVGAHLRTDSLSILVALVEGTGADSIALRLVALPIGLLVAVIAARRLPAGPTGFLVAVAASLLATMLFSKQSFANYYLLVGYLLMILAWLPTRRPAPLSAGRKDPVAEPVDAPAAPQVELLS